MLRVKAIIYNVWRARAIGEDNHAATLNGILKAAAFLLILPAALAVGGIRSAIRRRDRKTEV